MSPAQSRASLAKKLQNALADIENVNSVVGDAVLHLAPIRLRMTTAIAVLTAEPRRLAPLPPEPDAAEGVSDDG